jgi:pimeloyl-ACP methyl ester carboxylesterase
MTSQFYDELTRNDGRMGLLKTIDVPVKIIWGENDHYINVGVAQNLQSYFADASLDIISAGHWLQIDEPEAVAKIMLA